MALRAGVALGRVVPGVGDVKHNLSAPGLAVVPVAGPRGRFQRRRGSRAIGHRPDNRPFWDLVDRGDLHDAAWGKSLQSAASPEHFHVSLVQALGELQDDVKELVFVVNLQVVSLQQALEHLHGLHREVRVLDGLEAGAHQVHGDVNHLFLQTSAQSQLHGVDGKPRRVSLRVLAAQEGIARLHTLGVESAHLQHIRHFHQGAPALGLDV
mmetsp:Transcript_106999/g.255419  ORF Transcript_106999/g.255419 Transcript_106999/m.255419 type:complete len:210 (+) Transcript_106999:551-1180(+)